MCRIILPSSIQLLLHKVSQNWHHKEKIDLLPSIERSEGKWICVRERVREKEITDADPKMYTQTHFWHNVSARTFNICSLSREFIKFGCLLFGIWCLPFNFHRIVWCIVVFGYVLVCCIQPSYPFCTKCYTKCTWKFRYSWRHTLWPELRTKNVQYLHHRVDKSIIVKTYRCTP